MPQELVTASNLTVMEVQGCLCCFACFLTSDQWPCGTVLLSPLPPMRYGSAAVSVEVCRPPPWPPWKASLPVSPKARLAAPCHSPLSLRCRHSFSLLALQHASCHAASLPINVQLGRMQLHAFWSLVVCFNSLLLVDCVLVFCSVTNKRTLSVGGVVHCVRGTGYPNKLAFGHR